MDRAVVMSVFFLSGAAAILYQILWQRALFRIFGTSSDSVTLVVTAFMLGLGVGSLVGGYLSTRLRVRVLVAFGVIEALVGVFGFFSLEIFRWIGRHTLGATGLEIGLASFAALLLPTVLMGATLPLLSAAFVRASGNVGASVGDLYGSNTLGSAVAAIAAGLVLFRHLGEGDAVRLASAVNVSVAVAALAHSHLRRPA